MIITRLAGSSLHDLHAIVVKDDWELGDAVGVAHCDGTHWNWRARFSDLNIVGLSVSGDETFLLDSGGVILKGNVKTNTWKRLVAPNETCRSIQVNNENDFLIACAAGGLYRCIRGHWQQIDSGTIEDLYCVRSAFGQWIACGQNGAMVRYDGTSCTPVVTGLHGAFIDIHSANDLAFAAGTTGLVQITLNTSSFNAVPSHTPLFGVAALNEREVYCSSRDDGVLLWDGVRFHQAVDGKNFPGQVVKIGDATIACGGRDRLLFHSPSWQPLRINLDESFLN